MFLNLLIEFLSIFNVTNRDLYLDLDPYQVNVIEIKFLNCKSIITIKYSEYKNR